MLGREISLNWENMNNKSVFGLSENRVAMVAYIGFFIAGIVIFIMEKESRFVRFCAIQSTIFFIITTAVEIAISTTFERLPIVGPVILSIATTAVMISLVYLAYKANKGKYVMIPIIGNVCSKIVDK